MPTQKEVHRRRKDARPSEILEAASVVFAQSGFAATNLECVAALAQVSKGTIYHYFADKDVLFARVIETKLIEPLEQVPPLPLPKAASAGQTLSQALLLAYHQGKQSHIPALVRVLILEGERFAALRKTCMARLMGLATHTLRTILTHHDVDGRLINTHFYANPAVIFFPILCGVGLYDELADIEAFDIDAFVTEHVTMVCQAIDALAQPRLAT